MALEMPRGGLRRDPRDGARGVPAAGRRLGAAPGGHRATPCLPTSRTRSYKGCWPRCRARHCSGSGSRCATGSASCCSGARCWPSSARRAEERRRLEAIEAERGSSSTARTPRSAWSRRSCGPSRSASAGGWQAEEEERRREAAVKERLRQLKLEAARERLQEALSPLEEGARQLHAAVFEAATAIRSLAAEAPAAARRLGQEGPRACRAGSG